MAGDAQEGTPSPCISRCTVDQYNICTGCYRSVKEIRGWRKADESKRLQILTNAIERKKKADKGK